MENPTADPENLPPVWERLRAGLDKLRSALGKKIDPETRAKKLMERAQQVRRQVGTTEPAAVPVFFLAFTKSKERYGIPLENVLEVQLLEQFSPVPGAPVWVRGVVHWRGAILSLVDLSRLFGIAEVGLSDLHAYIVVEALGKRLALAASVVDDILTVPPTHLKSAPELGLNVEPDWILGVHDDNRLILKMDPIFRHLGETA
jgi:purine-binding chemotaxis protein CheW